MPLAELIRTIRRYRATARDGAFLLTMMALATLVAFEYDILSSPRGMPAREKVIELDEALALATLLCVGLLILSWRFLFSQRRELARRMQAEHRARELAFQDTLTGLPNRRRFDQELTAALAAPPRSDGTHAMFLLDLNDFKRINEVYGHGAGDEVLVNVALSLQRAVREGDLVARFGGDEFAVLARHLVGSEEATNIALRIITELGEPVTSGSMRHHIGVSIGIALVPRDGQDNTEILRKADIALYRAKNEPGGAFRFFELEMDAQVRERDLIERQLRSAIWSDRTLLPASDRFADEPGRGV
jgi:diguanylate cyclase (GGDEF)-like protein